MDVESDAALTGVSSNALPASLLAVVLVSTAIHQHDVKETSLIQSEKANGASAALVGAGGSPPQRRRPCLEEASRP